MKIKKYPQSCLMIESNNKKLDDDFIKTMIIKYDNCCEVTTFNWKYSILTRLIK